MHTYKWEDIQKAVNDRNRLLIERIGKSYNKPILHQEGVAVHEVQQQIIAMAPGNHPQLGPLLLDLAEKLKDENREWH